jgi:hypothetical protein
MLTAKSPGDGLSPNYREQLIGRVAPADLEADMPLPKEALDWHFLVASPSLTSRT